MRSSVEFYEKETGKSLQEENASAPVDKVSYDQVDGAADINADTDDIIGDNDDIIFHEDDDISDDDDLNVDSYDVF